MRYLCLVYHEESKLDALTDDELDGLMTDCIAWVGGLARGGHFLSSAGLQSVGTARTVRYRDGRVSATDGPFAETKEFLGGFTLIEASDLEEAVRLASSHPIARLATIEVRPLFEPDADLIAPLDRKIGASVRRVGEATMRHFQPTPRSG
jgi:hypothetical protein